MSLTFATSEDIEEAKQSTNLFDLTFNPVGNAVADQNNKKITAGVQGEPNTFSCTVNL